MFKSRTIPELTWQWPEAGWINSEQMKAIPADETSDESVFNYFPTVSVLVMTRNHADYLKESIQSILSQDFHEPYEILVGEDFSSDETLRVAEHLRHLHPSIIRLISSSVNVGIRSNFLRLVCRARAPYIAMLEGDDYWTRLDKLSLQVNLIRDHPEHSIVAAKTSNRTQWLADSNVYGLTDLLRRYVVHTSTLMIKRDHLLNYPAFPDNVCWESMMLGYLMSRGNCGFIPVEMSYYRRHDGGLWHNANRLSRISMSIECIEALDSFFFHRFHRELIDREFWILRMDAFPNEKYFYQHWAQTLLIQLSQAPRLLRRAPFAYLLLLCRTALQPLARIIQQLRARLALGSRWRRWMDGQ